MLLHTERIIRSSPGRLPHARARNTVVSFGGYISKRRKVGQNELKKSIGSLPLLKQKIEKRGVRSASAQLAHVCSKMFTTLESKGILRTGPEEFMLASQYREDDELLPEFIRTFHHTFFLGRHYVKRFNDLEQGKDSSITVVLPRIAASAHTVDYVTLYGFRGMDPRVCFLSPMGIRAMVETTSTSSTKRNEQLHTMGEG